MNDSDKLLTLAQLLTATGGKFFPPASDHAAIFSDKLNPDPNNLSQTFGAAISTTSLTTESQISTLIFKKVVYDSRQVEPGMLFVALAGELTDGHNYISAAIKNGAAACLVSEAWWQNQLEEWPVLMVVVPDTLKALQDTARWWRQQYPALQVVAVTGSVGKTSTKELIAAVLNQHYRVFKSPKSYNNETSLMPVVLEIQPTDEVAVLELGEAFVFDEITRMCEVIQPRIGVVTNLSHSHFERMGSLENIARSISELPQALPEDGVLLLNGDNRWVKAMAAQSRAKIFFYGTDPAFDLWADEIQTFGLEGIAFTVHYGAVSRHLRLKLLARHNVYNALAAIGVGLNSGLSWDEIESGLQDDAAVVRLVTVPGLNGATIIDDRYNASAVSMVAALGVVADTFVTNRKIALLGDILELGAYTQEAHEIVGQLAAQVLDWLLVVGEFGRIIGQTALAIGLAANRVIFTDKAGATEWLQANMQAGDLVLIKASRGIALEEVVEKVRANRV